MHIYTTLDTEFVSIPLSTLISTFGYLNMFCKVPRMSR